MSLAQLTPNAVAGMRDPAVRGQSRSIESPQGSTPVALPAIGDLMSMVAVVLIGAAFLLPKPATAGQLLMTFVLTLAAKIYFLPALFLLQITPTDFAGGNAAGFDVMLERFETVNFIIGPFPVNANYILLLAVVIRVAFEVLTNPRTLRGVMGVAMLVGWFAALGLDIAISLMSRGEGAASWTIPIRTTLVLASYWYGAILIRECSLISAVLKRRLLWIAIAWLVWTITVRLTSESMYFFYALLAAVGVTAAFSRRALPTLLGGGLLVGVGLHAAGVKQGATAAFVAGERAVKLGSTLTIMIVVVFGAALAGMRCYFSPATATERRRKWLGSLATLSFAVVVAGLAIPPFVVPAITAYTVEHDAKYGLGYERTLAQRVYYKLLVDRASVWRGTLQDVFEPPYIIRPMPQVSRIIFNDGSAYKWKYGSHNLLLELLHKKAWLSGSFCFFFLMVGLRSSLMYAFIGRHEGIALLAICSAAVGIGSSIGGSAVANAWQGFLFLGFAGLAQAQLVREKLL